MSHDTDADYFRMRSDAERELSRQAADDRVASTHAERADRYAQVADGFQLRRATASLVG